MKKTMKIPTAGDVLLAYGIFEEDPEYKLITSAMKEFSKIHLRNAVKAISENVTLTDFASEFLQEGASEAINKESILNAYPLTNII